MVPISYPESRLLEFVKNPTTWPSILKSRKKSGKKSRKTSEKRRGKNLKAGKLREGKNRARNLHGTN